MRHGLYLPPFGPFGDPAVLVDLAVRAEAAGWDGVFLWDHVVPGAPPIADPWTTLGAIASATSTLRLGPMVTPPARRRPWVLARQASTVSRLSHGRLILGTGLGSDETGDFSRFGEPLPARSAKFDEALTVLRAIWAGDEVRHRGEHFAVDLDASQPEPHPIPVWTALSAEHPRVLARAAAGDGVFPLAGPHPPAPETLARLVSAVRPEGRPFDVAVAGNASPAWDEPSAVDLGALAEAGMTWWLESLIHFDPLELSLTVVDAGPPRR
ncbi:LLM class flavin-dependent oxidoreductase [Amycolatopsis rhabdoformis]|uniref:LLM class flavin-dependent oxidoreductase n=1 Tax=Amycolatopsis rhabdoformis TaxID=1448059 RepID=A0ABZ1IFX5_9PSEU|nr:LLM class flavin-dependent oxidoreductase [Amycolatopsis rhabdoformis]WSE33360.1 LLM class flavin-dependent oxidoreductase [Amycolatopsis rhabdoformis]